MEFTPRIKQILNILLRSGQPVMEQAIADEVGVSKRTIQREFEYLESGITEYGLVFSKKKGTGVWLEGSDEEKEMLKSRLAEKKSLGFSDKEKRRKYLLFELLREKVPRKLYYFSDLFGVSEATISGDLEAVGKWLIESHIEIIKKPGYGVVLKGSERNYRLALQRFINENIDNEESRSLLYKDGETVAKAIGNKEDGKNIYDLLNSQVLSRVTKIFKAAGETRLKQMTDSSYLALVLHISIAIDRIFKGEAVEENKELMDSLKVDDDYILAERIAECIEKEFSIQVPKTEVAYILLHIKGSKLNYSDWKKESDGAPLEAEDILDMIDKMIDAFDFESACMLKCDEELIHGLLVHMEPTLIRLKNEMNIYNPLLQEIKKEYPEIFEKSTHAAMAITQMTGLKINEEEIGYLTMHFGAALERLLDHGWAMRLVEIGVICASGFGVARLMMTKMKNHMKQNVSISAYGRDEITPFIISKTDFFVSSMNMEDLGVDYIQVSPLITADDLSKIEVKAAEYGRMPVKMKETDFSRQLDDIHFMVAKIKGLIRKYQKFEIEENTSLEDFLEKAAYFITKNPAGTAVLKTELLAREQVMTQIFPEMEFALFHCRSKAVREPFFCTCNPASGEHFIHDSMKQIKAAILLVIPQDENRNQNAQMLGCISSALVEDNEFTETIFRGEEDRVREKLQEVLKRYFNEYLNKI